MTDGLGEWEIETAMSIKVPTGNDHKDTVWQYSGKMLPRTYVIVAFFIPSPERVSWVAV